MKKKVIYTVIITILILGTSTLTKYEELNNLAIISNINLAYKNGNYIITLQEIIPKKGDNKVKYEYKYNSITSNSIKKGFNKIKDYSHKNIYLKKVQNIIIDYKNRKKVFNSLINYYKSNKEINKNSSILITKLNIEQIYKIDNNYNYLSSVLKKKSKTINEIIKQYKKKKNIKIPLLILNNKELLFKKYINL